MQPSVQHPEITQLTEQHMSRKTQAFKLI